MALWVLYAAILNAAPNGLLPETRLCITRSATYPIPKSEISCSAAKLPADMVAAFSRDPKMITLDADMGLISGLQPGMLKHAGNRGHQCRHC